MVNKFLSTYAAKETKKLVKKLYNEVNANFLEHTMYDINDTLTSILALCDMEEMRSIPKIKQYIQRVNNLLEDVQAYQSNSFFNINHVLANIIDIIKDHFKDKAKINYTFSEVKTLVESNKLQLEYALLNILIELITAEQESDLLGVSIHLHQKEQDAQIIIKKANHKFSQSLLDEVNKSFYDFDGNVELETKGQGVQVDIRLPLNFTKSKKKHASGLSVTDIKLTSTQIKQVKNA